MLDAWPLAVDGLIPFCESMLFLEDDGGLSSQGSAFKEGIGDKVTEFFEVDLMWNRSRMIFSSSSSLSMMNLHL